MNKSRDNRSRDHIGGNGRQKGPRFQYRGGEAWRAHEGYLRKRGEGWGLVRLQIWGHAAHQDQAFHQILSDNGDRNGKSSRR